MCESLMYFRNKCEFLSNSQRFYNVIEFIRNQGKVSVSNITKQYKKLDVPYNRLFRIINYLRDAGIIETEKSREYINPNYPNLGGRVLLCRLNKDFERIWEDDKHNR